MSNTIKTRRHYTFRADARDNDIRVRVTRRAPDVGADWFHVKAENGERFVTHAQHLAPIR